MAPPGALRPDPQARPAANDMNSWTLGRPALRAGGDPATRYQLYRAEFEITPALANGRVHLTGVRGKAEFWLNGELVKARATAAPGEFIVALGQARGPASLVVISEAQQGDAAGIDGSVSVEPAQ
jgi:hypothetical protein